MIHKFGKLSYQYDPDPNCISELNRDVNGPCISNQPVSQFFSGGSCDETKTILQYWKVKEGDVVVDAGAHIGSWTLPTLAMGAAHVYCFEPMREALPVLKRNIELNGWNDRVTIIDKALWHKEDRLTFYNIDKGVVGHFANIYQDEYMVDCITLDSLNLPRLDWLKIDVEGAELAVLIGGRATIKRLKPNIIAEVHGELVRHIIPDFEPIDILAWLPPYELTEIQGYDNAKRFLLTPRSLHLEQLATELTP